MQNYRRHIEEHLLPAFEDRPIADILTTDISAWEKRERAVLYAESSIRTWRATLHLILADAVEEGIRSTNPAARRRGRGKRAGRSRGRGPEKVVTNALGILLLAERAALLSGRDDEFVAVVGMGFTGMRWAEMVGLETEYVRPSSIRVEWQLYELDTGQFHRCPPKDDSHRTVDTPPGSHECSPTTSHERGRRSARVMAGRTCFVVTGQRTARRHEPGPSWSTLRAALASPWVPLRPG